jgi:hypothetical protein
MFYAPPLDRPPALHSMASFVAATRDERAAKEDRFDVTRRHIPSPLVVGDSAYPLCSDLVGTFSPGQHGKNGEFVVPAFFPQFVGRGRGFDDAFLDWQSRVHSRFQDLNAKRPFEMTTDETAIWQLLESQIDVNAYNRKTPLTVRQIGRVAEVRPFPRVIEWENGRRESVRLEQMPGEFAAYKSGQPFEAVVVRDPVDFRLLKVPYIKRVKSLLRISADELNDLNQSIPTTHTLPNADWK